MTPTEAPDDRIVYPIPLRGAGGDGASLIDGTSAERFFRATKIAGCPIDQVENFLRAGIVLQPKQCLASALARLADRPGGPVEIAYGGARGGGKSHWLLAQLVEDCLRFPGLKCLMLRKVGAAGKEGFEDLLPKVLTGISYRYIPSSNVLVFANGSRIKLGHFKDEKDVDRYLGLEYDVIGVEEATTLSHSKYKAIQTCNRTSKRGWRPRIYSTTNPGGVGHSWYKARFIDPYRAGTETKTRFIPATIDDNRFVNVEYEDVLNSLTGWQLRAWRYGDWDIASGQYFTTFNRVFHTCRPFEFVPVHWRCWIAVDYGFKHYTVAYLLAQSGESTVYVVDEHAERRWLPEQHAEGIDKMLRRNGMTRDRVEAWLIGGDAFQTESDGRAKVDRYADCGIYFDRANQDRRDGAFELMYRLGDPGNADRPRAPSIRISDRCMGLLSCIPSMIHDERDPEKVAKVDTDDDGHGGDDWYDALRYGLLYVAGGPRVFSTSQSVEDIASRRNDRGDKWD